MASIQKKKWHEDAKNIWLFVSVVLGLLNLFLVLLLWNVSGTEIKTDNLAISLTVLEIFLAVVAVGGFWTLRASAREAAIEEATAIAKEAVKPVARAAATEYLSFWLQKNGDESATNGINDLMQALDTDEEGGDDEV